MESDDLFERRQAMNTAKTILSTVVVVIALGLVGCKKKAEPAAPPVKPKQPTAAPAKTKPPVSAPAETNQVASKIAETNVAVAAAVEQTMCPVMDGNKINKNVFVEYKGKKVYFCCADCKAKFEADPEKYIAKLPQFAK
jgi:YHS domain-containing protein